MTDDAHHGHDAHSISESCIPQCSLYEAPRGTTYDLWYLEQPDGSWVVKCEEHKAWKYTADSFDEAKAGAPTSLKRHHSRHLAFRHWVVGSVGI